MTTTHYEILGIARDADESTVRAAHRRLVKIYHPDLAGEPGAAMMKKLNEALDVLTKTRSTYDAGLSEPTARTPDAPARTAPAPAKPTPKPSPTSASPEAETASEPVVRIPRPNAVAYGWVTFAGFICWALFWVIVAQRPADDTTGFLQYAYPIILGFFCLLSTSKDIALTFSFWVNLAVIAAGPLFFLGQLGIIPQATAWMSDIGARSVYAEAVFAAGCLLVGVAWRHEKFWAEVQKLA